MPTKAPYRDGKFVNPLPPRMNMGEAMFRWIKGADNREPEFVIPSIKQSAETLAEKPVSGLRVFWLGHSTLLVNIDGAMFLTDPVWSDRASPVSFAGPKRFFAPPALLKDLPKLDGVLISHDHYDHLDTYSIKELSKTGVTFYVPLGVGKHIKSWGIKPGQIKEMDWWDEVNVNGIKLVSTPARHFSGRGLFDRDETLWASWSIVGPKHRIFFSGDSGYFPGYKEIGDQLGPFDMTFIESGAYDQAWADVHLGPEQAIRAHIDLKGKLFMPIHWGTFNLALHSWTEPAERVISEGREQGVLVAVPQPGDYIEMERVPQMQWWPSMPWQSKKDAPVVSSGLKRKNRK